MRLATHATAILLAATLAAPAEGTLPVTRQIRALIIKRGGPAEAGNMKPYTEKFPDLGNAEFEMLPVPGGSFTIGSPAAETGRAEDEGPQREIRIDPFWMAKTETTWALYRRFMENGKPRNKDGTINRDADFTTFEPPQALDGESLPEIVSQPTPPYLPMHYGMGDAYNVRYPALGMTQHAASKFCEWLSAQSGHFYRLPTEAEWEYACRAGTTTAYSFGDNPALLGDYGWFANNSDWEYQPVATKKANPWGFHDMHGNVAEWVLDRHTADGYAALDDGASNPWQRATLRYPRCVRGGHWNSEAAELRSAARLASNPDWKKQDRNLPQSLWYHTDAMWLGFRVVRPLKVPDVESMHDFWNTGPGTIVPSTE